MVKTQINRDPTKIEGQITYEIWPQGFEYSNEPILQAIHLDNCTDVGDAIWIINTALEKNGFTYDDYNLEVQGVVNAYFGPIIKVTILKWLNK